MDSDTVVVSKIIYFLFPYDVKCQESEQWITGHDPSDKDWHYGHPDGHQISGHGYYPDWMNPTTRSPGRENVTSEVLTTTNRIQTSTETAVVFKRNAADVEAETMNIIGIVVFVYAILFVVSFFLNTLTANSIRTMNWGLKHAIMYHLCLTGLLLAVSTSFHFLASVQHLVLATSKSDAILQIFAILAWVDHAVEFALLFFVFFLSVFCFFFYWKNRERDSKYGRSKIIPSVTACWAFSFFCSTGLAVFECDAHFSPLDYCISVFCNTTNLASTVITSVLLELKVFIPALTVLVLAGSIRVGAGTQPKPSLTTIKPDNHTDKNLMKMCCAIFAIYVSATLGSQILLGSCLSPILAVFTHHILVLVTTLATPMVILKMDRSYRPNWMRRARRQRTIPVGSFAFTTKKYKNDDRRDSVDSVYESNRRSSVAVLPAGPPAYDISFDGSRRESQFSPPSYATTRMFEAKKKPLPTEVLF